jgi:hypothetical protein
VIASTAKMITMTAPPPNNSLRWLRGFIGLRPPSGPVLCGVAGGTGAMFSMAAD